MFNAAREKRGQEEIIDNLQRRPVRQKAAEGEETAFW
jgi:hypothetical protein